MDNDKLLYGGIALIVLVLAIPILGPMVIDTSERDAATNRERLERVTNAVNNYARLNQRYPQSLHDLVPEYLAEVPLTVGRQPFQYDPRTGKVSDPAPEGGDGAQSAGRQRGGGGISPATDAMTGLSVSEELNY